MLKRTLKELKNSHGAAIVMALMAAVVLVVLALAIVTLSMGNLNVNQTDAMNNDAYYAADSGANSAVEQLKQVVADYYKEMASADSGTYDSLYNNFFANIKTRARDNWINNLQEPEFEDLTTETTFLDVNDTGDNVGEFVIKSISTAPDGSKYRVDAKLYVKRLDVNKPTWYEFFTKNGPYSDTAYLVGGNLTLNSGYGVYNGGDVFVSGLINPKNQYYYVQPPGTFNIESGAATAIKDTIVYPSYSNPTIGTPTIHVTVNNTILKTGSFPTDKPIIIDSAPGISFTVGGGTDIYPGSIIYKRGAGTLTLATSNANHTITAYSDGDVVTTNGPVYANIYCRGNVSTSGNFHGNVIADGNCTNTCNTFVGTMMVNGSLTASGGLTGSFYAGGPLSITNGVTGNSIIYSKTKISLGSGSYKNAVLFSGGDIDINGGSSLTGAIWAKGNVNQNSWLTLNYSRATVEAILQDNEIFFGGGSSSSGSSGGGGSASYKDIIVDQKVTAIGPVH